EGGATGVALVHGRVDLDEIVVRAVPDIAASSRDNAGRHGATKAERIANSKHPISDPWIAVRKLGKREVRAALDLDQGQVSTRVAPDHLRLEDPAVVGRYFDLVGAINHVIVGHGVTVGGNKEAGTLAGDDAASTRHA